MIDVTPDMVQNCLQQAAETLNRTNPTLEAEFLIKIHRVRGTSLGAALQDLEIPNHTLELWQESAGDDRLALRGAEILTQLYADTRRELRRLW